MVGCVGNAPTLVRLDIRFTGGSRSLRGYQPEMVAGRGMRGAIAPTSWVAERSPHGRRSVNRTTIGELMRLPWFCRSGGYADGAPRLSEALPRGAFNLPAEVEVGNRAAG
jgi:hypothetical protein